MPLGYDDYFSVRYFHEHKGDITRWVYWKNKKPEFLAQHPELIDAMDRLEIAKRTLDAVVKNLPIGED